MQIVAVEAGVRAVAVVFQFDPALIWRDRWFANRAAHVAARSAERTVRFRLRQLAALNRGASFLAQHRLVGHGSSPQLGFARINGTRGARETTSEHREHQYRFA